MSVFFTTGTNLSCQTQKNLLLYYYNDYLGLTTKGCPRCKIRRLNMKKNIMLTIFALCAILNLVGCKNGVSIENVPNANSGEYADVSQNVEQEPSIEKIYSGENAEFMEVSGDTSNISEEVYEKVQQKRKDNNKRRNPHEERKKILISSFNSKSDRELRMYSIFAY